jgi:VanZ family protein
MLQKILKTPWPSILWTGLIFLLLTIQTGSLESVPRMPIPHLDKGVHALLFGIYTWLLLEWINADRFRGIWAIVLLSAGYGTGMEFYQEYFTTREFEWGDVVADSLGAAVPAFWFWIKKSPYGHRGRNQN